MVVSVQEAVGLYQRISIRGQFHKLASLHDFPNSLKDNHFFYNPAGPIIDVNRLLKPIKKEKDKSNEEPRGSTMEELEEEGKQVDTSSVKFQEALVRLNKCLKEDNLVALKKIQEKNDLTEDEIVVGIGIHLVQTLSGKAETNKKRSRMKCPCGCTGKLDYGEKMYIGSDETWHGELDLFSLGVGVTATTDIEETSNTSDTCDSCDESADDSRVDIACGGGDSETRSAALNEEAGSQGERINGEYKLDEKHKNVGGMQHVISQAVVFGWTEHNRHRNLSPYIPSVYIDNHGFCIVVYNPVKDSLILAIHAVRFIDEALGIRNSLDVYSGIVALWIVFNHRLFFKKDIEHNVESGFKSQVAVHHYEKLTAFQSQVRNNFEVSPICFESCVTFGDKKRKRSSASAE